MGMRARPAQCTGRRAVLGWEEGKQTPRGVPVLLVQLAPARQACGPRRCRQAHSCPGACSLWGRLPAPQSWRNRWAGGVAGGGHGVPPPSRAPWGQDGGSSFSETSATARRWERQGQAWLPTSPSGFLLWLGSREPGLSQPNPEASFQDTLGAGPGPTHRPLQEEELSGRGSPGPAPDPRHRARLSQEWGRRWPLRTCQHEPPREMARSEVTVCAGFPGCQALP